jgi:hypothetical protein
MNKNTKILLGISAWGGLGFYRGHQEYTKRCKEDYEYYHDRPFDRKKLKYYYINHFSFSIFGLLFYVNPLTLPIMLGNEIINIDKIILGEYDDEKDGGIN